MADAAKDTTAMTSSSPEATTAGEPEEEPPAPAEAITTVSASNSDSSSPKAPPAADAAPLQVPAITKAPPHDDEEEFDETVEAKLEQEAKEKNEIVETSPKGRYVRFNDRLGAGAFKRVYRAYDTTGGLEVAWNSVKLSKMGKVAQKRIVKEMTILKQLDHINIIQFFGSWVNKETQCVIFVTEMITSGSLKTFIRTRPVRMRILKRWCRQILSALNYLHSYTPPIIHRDMKCDNIFVNGSTGDIRIGDLGLSTWQRDNTAMSVLGTPEYMAPELYDENYNQAVDIYAFGMCVLEMFTREAPYSECQSTPQIYKKVMSGILPGSFSRIKADDGGPGELAAAFIKLCILKPAENESRPTAMVLSGHKLLSSEFSDYDELLVSSLVRAENEEGKAKGGGDCNDGVNDVGAKNLRSEKRDSVDDFTLPVGPSSAAKEKANSGTSDEDAKAGKAAADQTASSVPVRQQGVQAANEAAKAGAQRRQRAKSKVQSKKEKSKDADSSVDANSTPSASESGPRSSDAAHADGGGARTAFPPHMRQDSGGLSMLPTSEDTDISNLKIYEGRNTVSNENATPTPPAAKEEETAPSSGGNAKSNAPQAGESPPDTTPNKINVNDKVVAYDQSSEMWYSGVITSINDKGDAFTVLYDDGDEGKDLSRDHVRQFPKTTVSRPSSSASGAHSAPGSRSNTPVPVAESSHDDVELSMSPSSRAKHQRSLKLAEMKKMSLPPKKDSTSKASSTKSPEPSPSATPREVSSDEKYVSIENGSLVVVERDGHKLLVKCKIKIGGEESRKVIKFDFDIFSDQVTTMVDGFIGKLEQSFKKKYPEKMRSALRDMFSHLRETERVQYCVSELRARAEKFKEVEKAFLEDKRKYEKDMKKLEEQKATSLRRLEAHAKAKLEKPKKRRRRIESDRAGGAAHSSMVEEKKHANELPRVQSAVQINGKVSNPAEKKGSRGATSPESASSGRSESSNDGGKGSHGAAADKDSGGESGDSVPELERNTSGDTNKGKQTKKSQELKKQETSAAVKSLEEKLINGLGAVSADSIKNPAGEKKIRSRTMTLQEQMRHSESKRMVRPTPLDGGQRMHIRSAPTSKTNSPMPSSPDAKMSATPPVQKVSK